MVETAEAAFSSLDEILPSVSLFVETALCKTKRVLGKTQADAYLATRDLASMYSPKKVPDSENALINRALRLNTQWESIEKNYGKGAGDAFLSETSFEGLPSKYKPAALAAAYSAVVVATVVVAADNNCDDGDLDTFSDATMDPLSECPAAQTADAFDGTSLAGVSIVVDCATAP